MLVAICTAAAWWIVACRSACRRIGAALPRYDALWNFARIKYFEEKEASNVAEVLDRMTINTSLTCVTKTSRAGTHRLL